MSQGAQISSSDKYYGVICRSIIKITNVCLPTDWEAVVKLSDDFNGADLRNVCTEAGKKTPQSS